MPEESKPVTEEPRLRKDPALACLLNLFLLGSGHMYLGQVCKGLLILVIGIVVGMFVWPLTLLVIVWAMYDAYMTAQKWERITTMLNKLGRWSNTVMVAAAIVILVCVILFFRDRQQDRRFQLERFDKQIDVLEERSLPGKNMVYGGKIL